MDWEVSRAVDRGIADLSSNHSVDETVERVQNIVRERGLTLFALVDHSGEADKVGLHMPPTKLVIFGSPKAGTPLMLAAPTVAIDLPLKILVWQDREGKTWISYNTPQYLRERHGFQAELVANVAGVSAVASAAGS
jgi:uncharacterized protein (DUF302 family)